jgi:predicted metal-dependent peptidase
MKTNNIPSFSEAYANMISPYSEFIEYNFWAYLVSLCKVEETKENFCAGVYFADVKYVLAINEELFSKYSLRERLAILKHEMLHILLKHTSRKNNRNHKVFNIASDCAINQLINKNHLPKDCITPEGLTEKFGIHFPKNLTSEQYYDILMNVSNVELESAETIDSHEGWSESDNSFEQELVKNMVREATEKSRGNIPVEISKILEIIYKKPSLTWVQKTKNLISSKPAGSKETIFRKSRRFSDRPEIRGKIKDKKFTIIAVLDVSGSMVSKDFNLGFSELKGFTKKYNTELKILQVDTDVHVVEDYNPKMTTFTRKGSGGTFMFPAIKFIMENKIDCDCVVLITDGFIENLNTWKQIPSFPIIFLSTNKEINGLDVSKKFYQFNLKQK